MKKTLTIVSLLTLAIGVAVSRLAVAGCNDCHTNPAHVNGGNPFMGQPKKINAAGYLGGGQKFGPFTSRNLTTDSTGMPAGMTYEMFLETFTKGTDFGKKHPQMGPLLQVMPWPLIPA